MAQLKFKMRPGAGTAQLVRYRYDATTKRSRTITVGSLRCDTDPENHLDGVHLADGQSLGTEEQQSIHDWLALHGDKKAAAQRREIGERAERRVREELMAADASPEVEDVFARAAKALNAACAELGPLAGASRLRGERPWENLRPGYLSVYTAWSQFAQAAQSEGIAKRKVTALEKP